MDVGEPIREIEVIPKHIPVPTRPDSVPAPAVTPKEKETVKASA